MREPASLLLDRLEKESSPADSSRLRKLKSSIARLSRSNLVPTDRLLSRYREEVAQGIRLPNRNVERALVLKEAYLGFANGSGTGLFAGLGMFIYATMQDSAHALMLAVVVWLALVGACVTSGL